MHPSRLAVVVSSFALAAACGTAPGAARTPVSAAGNPGTRPAEVTPEAIAAGKALYESGSCIQCHGLNGVGTQTGPPLNDRNWIHGRGFYNQIANIIISGFQQSDIIEGYSRPMPPRGQAIRGGDPTLLTDAQVAQVAAYVWSIAWPDTAGRGF